MGEPEPNGTVAIRLRNIERWMDRIDNLEPAVMKRDIDTVGEDIRQIAQDVAKMRDQLATEVSGVRALLTRFFVAMSLALVSGVIYVLVSTNTHP